jgi:hypothetical protein
MYFPFWREDGRFPNGAVKIDRNQARRIVILGDRATHRASHSQLKF